jgi:hypothetical protein
MKYHLAQTTSAFVLMASLIPCAEAADKSFMSVPRGTHIISRPAIPEDFRPLAGNNPPPFVGEMLVVDAVVNNTNPALKNDDTVGFRGEVSIGAVVQNSGSRIVLTDFKEPWGATAPLWLSTNRGLTWTKEFTINPPPGAAGVLGCPCDQTVDFNPRTGALAGTFLTDNGAPTNVFSALSSNLTTSPRAFSYFTVGGVAQATNHLDGLNNEFCILSPCTRYEITSTFTSPKQMMRNLHAIR